MLRKFSARLRCQAHRSASPIYDYYWVSTRQKLVSCVRERSHARVQLRQFLPRLNFVAERHF